MKFFSLKVQLLALLVAPVIAFGAAGVASAENVTSGGITAGADSARSEGDQPTDLFGEGGVFRIITNVMLFIIGAVSVIMLVIGGIRYTVSAGDSNAVTGAKNTIMYAIVGIVVAILAYAAVNFVLSSLISND